MGRMLGWALFLGMAACTPGRSTPTLSGMTPGWGFAGDDTPVQITGTGFFPAVSVAGGGELDWDRGFRAWLDGPDTVELEGVGALDYTTLAATVPTGLEVGVYDLRVSTPAGDELSLQDAFRATETRADHLSVSVESSDVDIGQYAVVQVSVLDPQNQLVQGTLPITVTLVVDGTASLSLAPDPALEDQAFDAIGQVVTGDVGQDGIGRFAVAADDTAQVAVLVSPSEVGSVVTGDMVMLSFEPGPVASVNITLPEDLDGLRAGDTLDVSLQLVDELGHTTSGTQAVLYLRESCPGGDLGETVYVLDALDELPVTITAATNLDCDENTLLVSGVADGTTFEGESEPFQVAPGAADHLDLLATPGAVEAGVDPLTLWVWVEDAWDNVVEDHVADLSLEDSAGGLDPSAGIGEQTCQPFSSGPALTFCEVWLWRTGDDVTITGRDTDGNTGISNSFVVTAGDLVSIDVSVGATAVVAGEPLEVTVTGLDALGNPLGTDPSLAGALVFRDDHGKLECERDRLGGDGVIYLCPLTVADADDHIRVTLSSPDLEASDTTEPFAVINGPLDEVQIEIGDVSVAAGAALAVDVYGVDEYGNAYEVGGDREITLTDLGGSLALATGGDTVVLDSSGAASTTATFTLAMTDDVITASISGEELGDSAFFDVVAGPLDGFSITPEATYGWLDEPLTVTIRAEDAYGNAIPTYDEPAELRSALNLGDLVPLSDWDAGVIEARFTYEVAGLGDTLDLWVDGAREARSTTVDALQADCDDGPTAAVVVAGDAPVTLCLSGGSTPSTTVSTSASVEGGAPLEAWHFDLGDGDWERVTTNAVSTTWTKEGAYRVRVVVADADGCADVEETVAYVADPDGQPAGPVTITLDDDTLNAGTDVATATLAATDCAGDPANGALLVWADLGVVSAGSTSALSSTGVGLAVEVKTGSADLSWSMVDDQFAGEATLRAGTSSGSAYGEVNATVSGDTARPLVLDVQPAGIWLDAIDSVTVRFTEPIPSRYLTSGTVVLVSRPGDAVPLEDPVMSEDDTVAEFPLTTSVIPGSFVLTLTTDVRDRSGNKLDGAWRRDGTASNFPLTFGDVTDSAPAVTGCPGGGTFRPDGDTIGGGEEADSITIEAIADTAPAWWVLNIEDADGADVRTLRVAAADGRDPLTWDGRDQNGFVVDNGEYAATVTAEDEYWNIGTSCSTTVTVDNRVVGLP